MVAIIMEHILVVSKLILVWLIPDKPATVRKKLAQSAFEKDLLLQSAALKESPIAS